MRVCICVLHALCRHHRLREIKRIWWLRSSLPEDIKACMSATEVKFAEGYDELVGAYQREVDLQLTSVAAARSRTQPLRHSVHVRTCTE